jgi:hypothetical protein
VVEPEAGLGLRNEPDMAALLDGQQPEVGIPVEGRVLVNLEWDQRIVFGLHQQGRYLDSLQELVGRLGSVIIVGGSEAECRSREFVVEFINAFHVVEMFQGE